MWTTKTLLLFLIPFSFGFLRAQEMHEIPMQNLALNHITQTPLPLKYSWVSEKDLEMVYPISSFQISPLVTYAEYKEYLKDIKRDSSVSYYISQLPDSNITSDLNIYHEYVTSSKYDAYPVLGISWQNAMNYCRWKNHQENISDTTNGAYRLPNTSEWLAALYYLENQGISHDLSATYSDWLLASYSENNPTFDPNAILNADLVEFTHPKEPAVYHRKRIIGNSFLFDRDTPFRLGGYGYDFEGYRNVGFRIVKGPSMNKFQFIKLHTKRYYPHEK